MWSLLRVRNISEPLYIELLTFEHGIFPLSELFNTSVVEAKLVFHGDTRANAELAGGSDAFQGYVAIRSLLKGLSAANTNGPSDER